MKKYTAEDLKFLILAKTENEQGHWVNDTQLEQYGQIILDAIFRPLKPLTDLVDAQHDCQKIFRFGMGIDYKSRHVSKDCIQMQGENPGEIMQIHYDGYLRIAFKFHGEVGSRRNHFALIDYIRELGYEPITKTS